MNGHGNACDVLHDHHQLVVVGEGGTELRDVRMIQAGEQLDFTQETSGEFFASGEIGQEDFHGLDAVGNRVADLVDAAHSAGAQFAENLVVANALDFFAHVELLGRVGGGCRDSSVRMAVGPRLGAK